MESSKVVRRSPLKVGIQVKLLQLSTKKKEESSV